MRGPRVRFWQKVLAALLIVGVAPLALVSVVPIHNTLNDPSYSVITHNPALFFSSPVAADNVVVAVVRTRVNLAAIWDIVEGDAGSVGVGAHSFLVDDYGIRLAVSETKGLRDQAESLIYKPIAPIDADTAKKLAADKRFGTITPDKLVIDPLPTLNSALA